MSESTRELLALLDFMQRVVIEGHRVLDEKTAERDELLRKLRELERQPEPCK